MPAAMALARHDIAKGAALLGRQLRQMLDQRRLDGAVQPGFGLAQARKGRQDGVGVIWLPGQGLANGPPGRTLLATKRPRFKESRTQGLADRRAILRRCRGDETTRQADLSGQRALGRLWWAPASHDMAADQAAQQHVRHQ